MVNEQSCLCICMAGLHSYSGKLDSLEMLEPLRLLEPIADLCEMLDLLRGVVLVLVLVVLVVDVVVFHTQHFSWWSGVKTSQQGSQPPGPTAIIEVLTHVACKQISTMPGKSV